jgi:hypothetical protein
VIDPDDLDPEEPVSLLAGIVLAAIVLWAAFHALPV